jgi:hypothetical protein
MPLPRGTWKINVNGEEGDLVIPATEDSWGYFTGGSSGPSMTVGDLGPLSGIWDEVTQELSLFMVNVVVPFPVLVFKGYLFTTPIAPSPGQDVVATLSGYVQVGPLASDQALHGISFLPWATRRNVFGWTATIAVLV